MIMLLNIIAIIMTVIAMLVICTALLTLWSFSDISGVDVIRKALNYVRKHSKKDTQAHRDEEAS